MNDFILYWAVRVLGTISRVLPAGMAVGLGRAFGRLAYWVQPKRQAVCLGNLKAALGRELSPEDLDRTCKQVFENMGMSLMEMLRTPVIGPAYVERHVSVQGKKHLDKALALNRGAIFVTGHFGNWELIGLTAGLKGYPASVLARQQGFPRLNRLLNSYRESKGCRVISKGMAVRQIVKRIKEGGIVGILADQDGGRRAAAAPFFGRMASTAQGPIALGRKLGCPVLPIFIVREAGIDHTLTVEPPLQIPQTGNSDRDIQEGIAAYLKVLERHVRQRPDQWLWLHRRWKSSPSQSVAALSDGKAGHRTQAAAVASLVEQVWNERARRDPRLQGMGGPWAKRQTIEIKFRSSFHRFLLAFARACGLLAISPAWKWLRWTLSKSSAKALEQSWAGVVVSCGASTALVSAVWSRSMAARTVHVMRPGWPLAGDFDLCIIPRHDGVENSPNTLVTEGALHALDSAEMGAMTQRQRKLWSLGRPLQIGFLVGGDAGGVRLPPKMMETVSMQLILAAKKVQADLLVVTSRRTSAEVERIIEDRFDQHENCPLLVLASRDRSPGYVQGVLSASSVVVVSGDSMSMISEAASSGKPVIVFKPETFWPWDKHTRFIELLSRQRFIQVVEPDQVCRRILDSINQSYARRAMDDRTTVLNRLRGWL
ncbi:MAG: mitochondrial fission ELM1 family protein [Candidatus Omnitrophica bacterium]|nr:mitochondrial fission ELM1 family protein [Candidatus Omnitrophota bacterium]